MLTHLRYFHIPSEVLHAGTPCLHLIHGTRCSPQLRYPAPHMDALCSPITIPSYDISLRYTTLDSTLNFRPAYDIIRLHPSASMPHLSFICLMFSPFVIHPRASLIITLPSPSQHLFITLSPYHHPTITLSPPCHHPITTLLLPYHHPAITLPPHCHQLKGYSLPIITHPCSTCLRCCHIGSATAQFTFVLFFVRRTAGS